MTEDPKSVSTNIRKAIYLIFGYGYAMSERIVNLEFLTAQRFR